MNQVGQYGKHRFWEIVPGFLIWGTFILAIMASFIAPVAAVTFIILFDLYWALRVLYFLIFVLYSYRQYKKALKVNWLQELKKIKKWDQIYHVVLLPTWKEPLNILRDALRAIDENPYPNEKFIVVLGGEERDAENFEKYARILKEEFGDKIKKLLVTVHPHGLPGEIVGKGANLNWMEKRVKEYIDHEQIPYENILVTAFDIDTIPHPQYYARLSYLYLTEPKAKRASFQPLVLYSNNIWKVPAPVRISMFGTTFWLMSELVRPDRMWTFSSHSMTWQMLVDVGFHEPDLVSEDSRIFLQGLIHYNGDYRSIPMFLPVYMDAVEGDNYLDGLKALYKQQRRWAWGVEHFPYMMDKFLHRPLMPLRTKLRFIFNDVEGKYTWATAPVLIFVLGYLPFLVIGEADTAFLANAPFALERMMQIATIGVFVSAFISLWLLPPPPKDKRWYTWPIMVLQWALLPITFIIFGALPAIDAQTRMMLGKYLGFNVTKKKR
ncbi:glycosyltransferase family 2 protein [Candidatus Parcubacteria bacterium]|nr:MAG: glycosyltransferase family 2 protein [Candidatus Parcubacteria bacterium]